MVNPPNARFNAHLQGVRAVAAVGVLVTHVAFQTGLDARFPVLGRLDFFVAVFFALSAFVLWRGKRRSVSSYYRRRFARLAPAYLTCVVLVLALFPVAFGATPAQVFAQLTGTQIYVPHGLVGGLTHLWSLCVEFAFYLVFPLLLRLPVWLVLVGGAAGFVWPWLIPADPTAVNLQIWPPSYAPWFAVGILAAELERRGVPSWLQAVLRPRAAWWAVAALVAWVASREWFGPVGLEHPTPAEFNARIAAGTVFAVAVVWPYALVPRGGSLLTTVPVQKVGDWSYSLFLWHVAVLSVAFPVVGVPEFSGSFLPVLAVTLAGSLVVAGLSYEVVEQRTRPRQGPVEPAP
ncbi:putative integral membrane acyltransferase [Corynebacterium renale]|uniref:acyltransferase family protein n=1 Tax=Corynebacterium renale TaxID=1724 RepID=UPI000DA2A594|nr:acyltransferase [Corynebacterium renale]SQG63428.1 putative integral membrane acyltransferase [Corynebacterium renale]STD00065.1 putative integral membrane acyltransferase [Corynebacterium renale]